MNKDFWSGLISGLVVCGGAALIYIWSVGASVGDMHIPLPSIGGNRVQEFVAPYSGEAFITAELESTGRCLWGSLLITRKEGYKLRVGMKDPNSCDSRNFSTTVTYGGTEKKPEAIARDGGIICHFAEFGVRTDDNVRPARIRFACPVKKFKHGEPYFIHSSIGDKGGAVDRHDLNMYYTYRRSRFW